MIPHSSIISCFVPGPAPDHGRVPSGFAAKAKLKIWWRTGFPIVLGIAPPKTLGAVEGIGDLDGLFLGNTIWIDKSVFSVPQGPETAAWVIAHEILHAKIAIIRMQQHSPLGRYSRHAILRTSWVFSAHGANFVKTMLRLSETHNELSLVDDEVGGPTSARAIASACLELARKRQVDPRKSGTYHFTGAPDFSWCDFARAIFAAAGRATRVQGIPTRDYPTPASRPQNSRLDRSTMETRFNITRPDWRTGLSDTLTELGFST